MRHSIFALLVLAAACAPAAAPSPAPTATVTAEPSIAEQVVQRQLEAYNAHDIDAFLATYADDVKMYQHPDTLVTSGLEQARETYTRLFTSQPNIHAAIASRIVQGDYVIDHEVVTGFPGGREFRAVAIYQVKNGKIQNVWFLQ